MCQLYKTANKLIYQSILNFKYGNYFSDKGLEQKYTIHYTEIKRTQREKEIIVKKKKYKCQEKQRRRQWRRDGERERENQKEICRDGLDRE